MARIGQTPDAGPESDTIEVDEDALREFARDQNLDYDTLNDEEQEFIANWYAGSLDGLEGEGDPETNPLIPDPGDETPDPNDPSSEGATEDGEESGSGPTPQPGEEIPQAGAPEAPSPTDPAAQVPPSPLPTPPAPGEPTPQPSPFVPPPIPQIPTIHVEGIGDVPAHLVRDAIALQSTLTPEEIEVLRGIRAGEIALPDDASPALTAQSLLPPPDEWEGDEATYNILSTIQQQFAMLQAQQAELLEGMAAEQTRVITEALKRGANDWRGQHPDLDDAAMGELVGYIDTHGLLPAFANAYPGDPSAAVQAALEQSYWSQPKYRDAAFQAQLAQHQAQTRTVEEKKGKASALVSSPGSTPRAQPAPQGTQEVTAAMAKVIESDMRGENGQG